MDLRVITILYIEPAAQPTLLHVVAFTMCDLTKVFFILSALYWWSTSSVFMKAKTSVRHWIAQLPKWEYYSAHILLLFPVSKSMSLYSGRQSMFTQWYEEYTLWFKDWYTLFLCAHSAFCPPKHRVKAIHIYICVRKALYRNGLWSWLVVMCISSVYRLWKRMGVSCFFSIYNWSAKSIVAQGSISSILVVTTHSSIMFYITMGTSMDL